MFNWFTNIVGSRYAFEAYSLIFTFLESQFAISLFCRQLTKRDAYPLRLIIASAEAAVLCFLLAVWNTESGALPVRVLCYLIICGINLGFVAFCWSGSPSEMLMAFCSGLASYQIGNKLYPLLQNLRGINDRTTISLLHAGSAVELWELVVFYASRFAVYIALALLLGPKGPLPSGKRTRRNIVLLSFMTIAIVNVLVCVARVYEADSMPMSIVVKIFTIAFSAIVLLLGAGIIQQSEKEQQINVLNQLMKQEKLQFDSVKANMDVINMKCHDLKHIIDKLENKLTDAESDSLREAIRFYDANIKTGSEVLDVVLCEKAILCEKKNITFSCMANGPKFAFLTAVQTYSLFGNIIDNAIEAIEHVPDPEKKVISLICSERGGCPVIEESNYFTGELHLTNGLPSTTKEDSARHGFGTKSIRYIAEQYGGVLEIKAEDGMFFLEVRFPAAVNQS